MQKDPKLRPCFDEVAIHKFFRGVRFDELEQAPRQPAPVAAHLPQTMPSPYDFSEGGEHVEKWDYNFVYY